MKKTSYHDNVNYPLTFFFLIILLILIFACGYGFIYALNKYIETKDGSYGLCMVCAALFEIFTVGGLLSSLTGILKAKRHIKKKMKEIKLDNPYIYYRELPNNFGIGVNTLLLDSTLENEKDIVAVILDLCAKKYLKLEKNQMGSYNITVLKPADNMLLKNEMYIMKSIETNNIKDIDFDSWFKLCMEDGIQLGLFTRNTEPKLQKSTSPINIKKIVKRTFIFSIVFSLLVVIGVVIYKLSRNPVEGLEETFDLIKSTDSLLGIIIKLSFVLIFTVVLATIILAPLSLLFLLPVFYIIMIMSSFKQVHKDTLKIAYNSKIEQYMIPTEAGAEELKKLQSFKAFLKDFGAFSNKNPEEVMLWEYYLSFAQVFGISDEIMKTGYKELVKNASFNIDNIDSINLSNINLI